MDWFQQVFGSPRKDNDEEMRRTVAFKGTWEQAEETNKNITDGLTSLMNYALSLRRDDGTMVLCHPGEKIIFQLKDVICGVEGDEDSEMSAGSYEIEIRRI